MRDQFGESGEFEELMEHFGLTPTHVAMSAHDVIAKKKG
jgi:transketolase